MSFNSYNAVFFILWAILASLVSYVDDSNVNYAKQEQISDMLLLILFVSTTYFLCNYLLPKVIAQSNLSKVLTRVLSVTLFQVWCIWLFQKLLYLMQDQALLNFPLDPVQDESLIQLIANVLPITLMLNLGFAGLKFYFEHTKLNQQHMALEKIHLENKLSSLQAQINPHFMFNVLNHIHILIQKDSTLASSILLQYADILRYQLDKIESPSVAILEEVKFMKSYIEVEKLRWQNTLDVKTDWQISNTQQQLPPLLFIIFIENAFKHVSRSRENVGYINIKLTQKPDSLVFFIENSINEIAPSNTAGACLGLSLIQKRLALLFPNNHSLQIEKNKHNYNLTLTIQTNAL